MHLIKSENISPFDVDHTLILPWTEENSKLGLVVLVKDTIADRTIKMVAHNSMIRLLKEEKHRGSFVIVWSRGGYGWAKAVIDALGLEKEVDMIMTKPRVYFDDLPVKEWLKDRVYLKPGTIYKD